MRTEAHDCIAWDRLVRLGPSLSFLFVLLLVARLCPSLGPELVQLFQVHEHGGSSPKFVQACRGLHAQAICERTRSEGLQHMMNCHLMNEVSDAHSNLFESVDELSDGLSILLADADQGNGCSMMGSARREMDVELGHQCFKAIY